MSGTNSSEEPWNALDVQATAYFRFSDLVFAAGLALLSLGAYLASAVAQSSRDLSWLAALPLIPCAGFLLSSALAPLRYRRWQWRLTPWSVETRSGVWSRKYRSLPRSRFVYLEIHAGPIRRHFHLSRIELCTSGSRQGAVIIPALSAEEVHDLRSALGAC